MSSDVTFVLVGHCGADSYSLQSTVRRAVPAAKVVSVDDSASLESVASQGAVLLINRVLDGGFETNSGIELIRQLASHEPRPVMMLISNYADAQEAAIAAGAVRGFGKSQMGAAGTQELLRSFASVVR